MISKSLRPETPLGFSQCRDSLDLVLEEFVISRNLSHARGVALHEVPEECLPIESGPDFLPARYHPNQQLSR